MKLNLLVIAPDFPDEFGTKYGCVYIKEQLEYIRDKFNEIYVLVPTPYTPQIPIKKSWKNLNSRKNYNYKNVHVMFPRFFTPPSFITKDTPKRMASVILKTLNDNNIKINLIHSHFTYPTGYAGALVKKAIKKPLIITVHEDADWLRAEMMDKNCVFSWKNADAIIRVNNNDLYLFYEKGIPKNIIFYIPNGYDHTLFKKINKRDARRALNLSLNKKIVLNIGTLEERKGQKLIINSIKLLKEKYKDLQLIIIGNGPIKSKLEDMIISGKLEDTVFLLNANKKREEIPLWMNACDIFVLSSYSEGNPTVMFEALGCGMPYIGSDVGGSSSVINNVDVGALFKPGDIQDMIIKIEGAIRKKWNEKRIIKFSRKYSWKTISLQIKKVYDKVML